MILCYVGGTIFNILHCSNQAAWPVMQGIELCFVSEVKIYLLHRVVILLQRKGSLTKKLLLLK